MAPKMYPEAPIVGKTSPPEHTIFNELARQLSDEFIVLHSLRTFDHEKKPMAEADFVIIGPAGILVLEVKGFFRCVAGVWEFADDKTKTESPLEQASGCMFAIMNRLDQLLVSSVDGELHRAISFGSGFVSTKTELPGDMVEIPRELFIGPRKMTLNPRGALKDYVLSVQEYWLQRNQRQNRSRRRLTADEVKCIANKLRPDVSAPLDVFTNLKLMDGKMAQATDQQHAAIRGALSNPRLLIEGMAGTGKTVLAVNVANSFAAQGKRVLLLCFNENLSSYLAESVSDSVRVSTVHKMFSAVTSSPEARELLRDYPEESRWCEGEPLVFSMFDATEEQDKYDVLILDEAQDVMTRNFLDAIFRLVKGGVRSGNAVVFYDSKQDIYSSLSAEALEFLNSNFFFKYSLNVNCRNTSEVAALASVISEVDVPINDELVSGRKQSPKFVDKSQLVHAVRNEIVELSAAGLGPRDIVVLSPVGLEKSAFRSLAEGPSPLLGRWAGAQPSSAKAMFSTIHGFKGLEAAAIIIVDLDLETQLSRQQLLYVGCTRAKAVLTPAFPASNQKTFNVLLAGYGVRIARK